MVITQLTAENFKRLSAITINPDGSTVVIGGKNGVGKSSALDAIQAACGGKKYVPTKPIRRGTDKAVIVLQTETLVVRRTFTAKGTQLEIKSQDGATFAKPQELLDELTGKLSFDPMAFARLKPREQADRLRQLVGLDLTELDTERKETFDERTDVNRDVKRFEGEFLSLDQYPDAPAEEVSVTSLADELERRRLVRGENDDKRKSLGALREEEESTTADIERYRAELAAAEKQLTHINERREALTADIESLIDPDCQEIRNQISIAEETNAKVRENAKYTAAEEQVTASKATSENLTARLANLDTQRAETIAAVDYPVEGLSVGDDGISLDGVPFDQAGSANQIRCSVAIGLALNPQLRVLLIRDGSLLDPESLAMVAQMASDAEAQLWIERVSEGDEVSVIIEDGAVRE